MRPRKTRDEGMKRLQERNISLPRCAHPHVMQHALGQTVQRTCKDYQGPRLGIKQTEANVREWTREQQEEQVHTILDGVAVVGRHSKITCNRGTWTCLASGRAFSRIPVFSAGAMHPALVGYGGLCSLTEAKTEA